MTEQILPDDGQTYHIQVADVASYLHQTGWEAIAHPNPRLLVFQGKTDYQGNPIQIVLPSQNSFEDSPRLKRESSQSAGSRSNKISARNH